LAARLQATRKKNSAQLLGLDLFDNRLYRAAARERHDKTPKTGLAGRQLALELRSAVKLLLVTVADLGGGIDALPKMKLACNPVSGPVSSVCRASQPVMLLDRAPLLCPISGVDHPRHPQLIVSSQAVTPDTVKSAAVRLG
jgi:hypothetical protein